MSDLFYVKAYDNKTNEYRLVPAKYLQTAGGDFVVNNNLDYYRADPNYTRANALYNADGSIYPYQNSNSNLIVPSNYSIDTPKVSADRMLNNLTLSYGVGFTGADWSNDECVSSRPRG